jgi:hypothetical protein
MKAGDAIALNLALNSWGAMTWFLKQWVHAVLKEKCIVLLWRNLVRRTCVSYACSAVCWVEQRDDRVQEVQAILEDPTSIAFYWLSIAFRLSYDVDEGWGAEEVQAVLMSLIIQVGFNRVPKGYLLIPTHSIGIYQRHNLGR